MKLIKLLQEKAVKQKLKEFNDKTRLIGRISEWELKNIGNPAYFDIHRHWRSMWMAKQPDNLSEEELPKAIAECDENIKYAEKLLQLAKKAKTQIQGLTATAAQISAGEKEYAGRQITPQHVLDFLESILVTDKGNKQEIYELYNAYIEKNYPNEDDLFLTSPDDLVVRGRIKNQNDVLFEYKRQSGGQLSEGALYSSVFKFVKENYPEVAEHLLIRTTTWSHMFKKNFIIRVRRSSMTSRPALNRSWRRIFIKYADWLAD